MGDAFVEGSLAWHSSDRLPWAPSGEPRGELRLEVPDARQHPSPCLGSKPWWRYRLARQLICPFIDRWKSKAERGSGELSAKPRPSCLSAPSQECSSQHEAREQRRQAPSRGCQSGSKVARAEGVWEGPAPGIVSCRGQLRMTLKSHNRVGSSFAGAPYGFSVRH